MDIDDDQVIPDEEAPGPQPDISGGWNYRLVRKKHEVGDEVREVVGIHEVFYGEDGEPHSCTKERVAPMGRDGEDLAKDFARMEQAFDKEVLDYEEFSE